MILQDYHKKHSVFLVVGQFFFVALFAVGPVLVNGLSVKLFPLQFHAAVGGRGVHLQAEL